MPTVSAWVKERRGAVTLMFANHVKAAEINIPVPDTVFDRLELPAAD